ncbi:MAG: flippase [bacterium]|nr:flippase [bacterium]
MDKIKQVSSQTAWQLLGKGVSASSTIVVLGVVSRNYGEDGTGIFTLALAYLSFLFLAADLGLNSYVLPRINKNLDEVNKLFNFRLIWSGLLVILANILVYLLPFSTPLFNISVLFGSLTIVSSGFFNSTTLVFQKNLRYDQSVIAASFGSLTVVPVILILSQLGLPISSLALAPLSGWVVNNLVAFLLVRKFYRFRVTSPDWTYPLQTLKVAWPISLTLLLNTVYFRLDTFILSTYHSFTEVGIYNFAYQFFQTALVLPTFIMNSYYPLMIEKFHHSKQQFKKELLKATGGIFLMSLLAALGTWIFSPFLIPLVSGSSGFSKSTSVLQVLSLGYPAYFVSAILMWTMVLFRRYKTMLFIYVLGLTANTILNIIFIPLYSYQAAAWITVVSEYLILILELAILRPLIFSRKLNNEQ